MSYMYLYIQFKHLKYNLNCFKSLRKHFNDEWNVLHLNLHVRTFGKKLVDYYYK